MSGAAPAAAIVIGRVSRGFVVLLAFLGLGEWIAAAAGLRIPGNVIGMALLTAALLTGLVKLAWVEDAADALLSRFGLLFVPPGVGVMLYFDAIRREWLPLTAALVGSTFLVAWATAGVATLLARRREVADDPR